MAGLSGTASVAASGVEVDPRDVGFDAGRLSRIDSHFQRYVADGRLPGWLILVNRGGRTVHLSCHGQRDLEAAMPVETDTVFRIYSMSKPITSVAAMMLYEAGAFELTDPVSKFIPAFRDVQVFLKGSSQKPMTVPVGEPMRIWHLLTHTSGLTYGFMHVHAVDEMYRAAGFEWAAPDDLNLADTCDLWASLPLLFEPGTEWNYSHATDVLGRIVEVASGQALDRFFDERIFKPLGMADTGFATSAANEERLAALYVAGPDGRPVRHDLMGDVARRVPPALHGGSGLVSTAGDYLRFTSMIRNRGQLDGVRLLGSRTVAYMGRNHLPGGADLETFGRPLFAESPFSGVGFGLGFAVVVDPAKYKTVCSLGELAWGGAASTAFWIDPVEDLVVLFFTQLLPSSTYPLRTQLRQMVYQALVD